ncbi:MAG: TM2 domain-containing protein [Microbacterium sp.]|uniref:TM2 domain-containing protein n=1 Tax=Microbacterium sp. TaxID=51671 RepID=UPI001AD02152|nr:TM2 domain-containing protein [Microbacterium sp.]MBN9176119.1 TM2 domain-containing protein [Microbacterium sp.]
MTIDRPSATPPGWYPNQRGVMQWWDGYAWGPLAPTAAPIVIHTRPMKDTGIAYLLLILLGGFAAHRFYLGYTASAITMLLLWWIGWALSVVMVGFLMIGAVVVWWIVDLFLIPSMTRERNMRP